MGSYKKGVYWKKEQEDLCILWNNTGNTQNDYTRIYLKLEPSVSKVAEIILHRYFQSLPWSYEVEIKKDAIQHFFLKLNDFNPKAGTAYNFAGTLIKHFFYDTLVNDKKKLTIAHNHTEFVDDYDEHVTPIIYEETEPIDYDSVIRFLQNKKKILIKKDKLSRKIRKNSGTIIFQREMAYIDLIIEYIEKFQDITPASIADYVFNNTKNNKIIKIGTTYYLRKILGIETHRDKKNKNNPTLDFQSTERGIKKDRYNYFNDDVTPNQKLHRIRQRKDDIRKKYPDLDKYSYL